MSAEAPITAIDEGKNNVSTMYPMIYGSIGRSKNISLFLFEQGGYTFRGLFLV